MAYSIEVLASARMGACVRTCFADEHVVGDVVFNGSWATFTEQPEEWVCTAAVRSARLRDHAWRRRGIARPARRADDQGADVREGE